MKKEKEKRKQYHHPVCAGLQIALADESPCLSFEEEHQLGTGAKSIDCLIIKKEPHIRIKTDIGRIFRGHNIIEIKGVGNYLSIDQFYKGLGYLLFYKADAEYENSIDIDDLTLTFICPGMPLKLLQHLKKRWKLECSNQEAGIYYLEDFIVPIQLIIASRLNEENNLLLKSILTPVQDQQKLNTLLQKYQTFRGNGHYEKAISFIFSKEKKYIRRENNMGLVEDTLFDVYRDHIDAIIHDKVVRMAEEKAKEIAEERAHIMVEERANIIAEERANIIAEKRANIIAEERANIIAEERANIIAEERANIIAEKRANIIAEERTGCMVKKMLQKGLSPEEINEYSGLALELVIQLQQEMD